MAEITTDAYQAFLDYLNSSAATPTDWDYIALFDDTDSEVIRVSITGDSRCQWTDVDGDATLKAEITVSGGDSDITTPVTIAGSQLFQDGTTSTGMTALESFSGATLDESGDKLTVRHSVDVPK